MANDSRFPSLTMSPAIHPRRARHRIAFARPEQARRLGGRVPFVAGVGAFSCREILAASTRTKARSSSRASGLRDAKRLMRSAAEFASKLPAESVELLLVDTSPVVERTQCPPQHDAVKLKPGDELLVVEDPEALQTVEVLNKPSSPTRRAITAGGKPTPRHPTCRAPFCERDLVRADAARVG